MALPGQPSGVNNTAFVFGTSVLAFVIWVTAKGDLPKWLGLMGLGGTSTAPPAGTPVQPATPVLPSLPTLPSFGTQ